MPETAEDTVQQLDTLVGSLDTHELTITDIDGSEHTFPIQTFSNFKTAQVLKMLAGVRTKVDVVKLIQEMRTLTKTPDLTPLCPHCFADGVKTVYDPKSDDMTDKKEMVVGCHVCFREYHLKDAVHDPNDPKAVEQQANRLGSAFEAIPMLLEFAPDLLFEFAALAITTNKELEDAYDSDGGIAKITKQRVKWIQFHCTPDVPIKCLVAYLPSIGLDFIIRELGTLDQAATRLLTMTR